MQDGNSDDNWALSKILVWVAAEADLALICGCFPALKVLVRRMIPKWFGTDPPPVRDIRSERIVPDLWQSELCTITTGVSGGSAESKENSGGPDDARIKSGFDSGTTLGYNGSNSTGLVPRVQPGQVIPEPDTP